jgi:hypothetical protein
MIVDDIDNNYIDWIEAEPNFASIPEYCPPLKAFIHVGSFLYLNDDRVVRLVGVEEPTQLIGNLYTKLEGDCPAYEESMVDYLRGLKNCELCQTLGKVNFCTYDIKDIAFVFSSSDIEREHIVMHGIKNAFFCRFKKGPSSCLTRLSDFCCFPSFHEHSTHCESCFPLRIWRAIYTIQDTFRSMLSNSSEGQGAFVPNKRKKIFFSSEAWKYIYPRMGHAVSPIDVSSSKIKQKMLCGATAKTVRFKDSGQKLILTTQEHYDALEGVFGSMVLFGFRRKRPKVGMKEPLCVNNEFNVIAPNIHNEHANTNKKAVLHARVIFVMDQTELLVSLSFGVLPYVPASLGGEPSVCGLPSLTATILHFRIADASAPTSNTARVRVNRRFRHNGVKYKVVSVASGTARCKRMGQNTDDTMYTFDDLDYVGNQIAVQIS